MSRTFIRSQVCSLTATAIDFSVAFLSTTLFGVWHVYANTMGLIAGAVLNFTLSRQWVFEQADGRIVNQLFRYTLVWGGNALLNIAGTWALTEVAGISFIISKTCTAIIVALTYNYVFQKEFVFKTSDVPN